MIFNSDTNALIYVLSAFFLTILMATVVSSSPSTIFLATPFMTTPKAPDPSCLPARNEIVPLPVTTRLI